MNQRIYAFFAVVPRRLRLRYNSAKRIKSYFCACPHPTLSQRERASEAFDILRLSSFSLWEKAGDEGENGQFHLNFKRRVVSEKRGRNNERIHRGILFHHTPNKILSKRYDFCSNVDVLRREYRSAGYFALCGQFLQRHKTLLYGNFFRNFTAERCVKIHQQSAQHLAKKRQVLVSL